MSKRRVQSISPNDPQALQKVIEALEVSEGIRGNKGDRKPTIDEVKQMLSGQVIDASLSQSASTESSLGGGTTPNKPSGLSKKELSGSIVIGWAIPTYSGHGETEVYRSLTANLADAEIIGSSSSNHFVDWSVVEGETYNYFIRHKQVFSLGGNTGAYAAPIEALALISAPISTILSGALLDTDASVIDLGVVDDNRSLLISATGYFTSNIDYDFALEEAVPETGNAASLEIKVNGVILEQAIPIKEQPCVIGPYGQATYNHRLDISKLVKPSVGNLEITLTAQRLFLTNVDPFSIPYTITLL